MRRLTTVMQNGADGPERLGLLASAVSGRALRVAPGAAAPAWTDGATVFVDAAAGSRDRVAAVAVQAALLGAGSLEPEVVRRLRRRPDLARRYLAVEGHRALAASLDLLPPGARRLVDHEVAALAGSPGASLALALSARVIAHPPTCFGELRPGPLLAARAAAPGPASTGGHVPGERRGATLAEPDDDRGEAGSPPDPFSSPVGGGGGLGRLLRRLLLRSARSPGGGAPGADAPSHRTSTPRRGARGGPGTVTGSLGSVSPGPDVPKAGVRYPEWDARLRAYRPGWCTVLEAPPRPGAPPAVPPSLARALRRPLAGVGLGLERRRRQPQGDDIDVDAAVEARVETLTGAVPRDAVHIDSRRRRRDLSVLVLLDVSGSVAEPGAGGVPVHHHQREAAAALVTACHDLGDRVALYAFRSRGRAAVHLDPVKRFDDGLGVLVRRRLGGLEPCGYTRLGAAIRHGSAVLTRHGGTSRRLLVVLSDGFAYDHGYERRYGEADARRALAEARRRGVACVCLSVGAATDLVALRRVFGTAAHAAVARPDDLDRVVGPLFRAALGSAEVRRRVT